MQRISMPELICTNPRITYHHIHSLKIQPHCKYDIVHHHTCIDNGRTICNIPGPSILGMHLYSSNGFDLLKVRSVKLSLKNKNNSYEICILHISGPTLLTDDFNGAIMQLPFGPLQIYHLGDSYDIIVDCEHTCPNLEVVFQIYIARNAEERPRFETCTRVPDRKYTLTQTQYMELHDGLVCRPLRIQDSDRACYKIVIASVDGKALLGLTGTINTDDTIYPINDFVGKHLYKAPHHCYVLEYGGSAEQDYRHIVLTRNSEIMFNGINGREVCITYYYHDVLSWNIRKDSMIDAEIIHPITYSLTHPVEVIHLCHQRPNREYELAPEPEPEHDQVESLLDPEDRSESESESESEPEPEPEPYTSKRIGLNELMLRTIATIIDPLVKLRHTKEKCIIGIEDIPYGECYVICPQCSCIAMLRNILQWMYSGNTTCPMCRYEYVSHDDILYVYKNCSYNRELLSRYLI